MPTGPAAVARSARVTAPLRRLCVPGPSRERLYSARERFILTPAGRRRTFSRHARNSKPLFRKRENMKDQVARRGNAVLRLLLIGSVAGAISCGDDQTSVPSDGTIEIV